MSHTSAYHAPTCLRAANTRHRASVRAADADRMLQPWARAPHALTAPALVAAVAAAVRAAADADDSFDSNRREYQEYSY